MIGVTTPWRQPVCVARRRSCRSSDTARIATTTTSSAAPLDLSAAMAGAPYPFVNPNWISLTAGTGTHFEDPATTVNANAPRANLHNPPFTPFVPPPQPPRTTYGPFRHQYRNPTFAPFRPASPRRSTLDPTARSFTPPQQGPSRLVVETKQEQDARAAASAASPRTPVTPRIELSPAEDVVADAGLAAVQAARQLSRTRRDSSPGRRPAGVQRRPSQVRRRSQSRASMPPPSQTPVRPQVPQFVAPQPTNNDESIRAWLDGPYAVGFNDQLPTLQSGAQGIQATSNPQTHPRPGVARSTTGTTTTTATGTTSTNRSGPYFCSDPSCTTPLKAWPTPSALDKHARTHLPMSARPYGCRAERCAQRFWWPKDQIRHERRMHQGESVLCGICGDRLSREDNLARHLATVHRELEPPVTPSGASVPSPAMSMRTVTTEYVESFAAQTPRSEVEYSLTVPSSPPSTGAQYHPHASGSRAGRSRHLSFASAQGPPPVFRAVVGSPGSQAMEKSQSSDW